ncbi:PepX_C domain-containing protein, partial [Haematococcus lacustris]
MELTGCARLVLRLSCDAPDLDLHATLVDEYPPSQDWPQGFSMNLASGIARARFRQGHLEHE